MHTTLWKLRKFTVTLFWPRMRRENLREKLTNFWLATLTKKLSILQGHYH